ncbi:MAG: N-acetylneuraminate synthase [Candidatus Marinimicrobia bacterium]|nr:N-acetylneuraminate synthase [Candidatus Neomarinimicrobiota bacterium]|tara:strand:+ start:29018 stop:30022 length:1005 start_codon:yes stop_codon:yes gene_type:complete
MWGGKSGVYLIAEIGGNHEGNFDKAKELTELACKSGVDAVKLQIYTADSLVSKVQDPERHTHFKRFELTPDQHIALAKICQSNNVTYSASVWDMDALEWIDPYMEFYKIGSGDLTAYPILETIARIGKPIIMSTGLSTLEEVKQSVKFIRSVNRCYIQSDYLALLQCTSSYPLPESDVNLRVMETLKDKFDVTVGYSDHTTDACAAEVSVAMGAEIVELHFTDDKNRSSFRDHQVSFTTAGVSSFIAKIKRIKKLQGSPNKNPTQSEINSGHINSFRRGIYANKDLTCGDVLTESDIGLLRPNHNLETSFENVIGKQLKKSIQKLNKIDSGVIL